jgi:hypothetical protein
MSTSSAYNSQAGTGMHLSQTMSTTTPPNLAGSRPNQKGGRKPGQSVQPRETRTEWLEPLLLAAKAGVAAGESCPIPYVKGAFGIVVLLLETVQVSNLAISANYFPMLSILENEEKSRCNEGPL